MHIKKGDNVTVIAGKDKGKKGVVTQALPSINKVIIDGINIAKRHEKKKKSGEKGQIVEVAMPIHSSNVKLSDAKAKKAKTAKA